MRWKLGILIAIAALPAVAAAQQGQQQSSGSQDTTHAYRSDSSGKWKSDSTGMHHRHRHHRKHMQTSGGEVSDTTKNQTQSGVVNKSGRSTLGPGVKKTSPTHGMPVTSKGDTLRKGGDTTRTGADTTRPQMGDTTQRADSTQPRTP